MRAESHYLGGMDGGLSFEITRDARAARALRRAVFTREMGVPTSVETDAFDAVSEHAILRDPSRPDLGAIAAARLAPGTGYTGREFDLWRLHATGRPIVELGRTCVHPAYRGSAAGLILFHGIAKRLAQQDTRYLVGTASLPGAEAKAHLGALRALRAAALAPPEVRPVARGPEALAVTGPPPPDAMRTVPPLIKSYLRAGAWVGDGAWVDRAFGCVDICILLDMTRLRLPGSRRRAIMGAPA
ncbi:GNAT family N-acetyltransferase [Jannaschia formosa]|uniref:GNAT family N-acetyltransferase n=1 Tax=Jannaschia formosa TaxID=2259592 RepID=UPI00142F4883|nr:GNAT family N-acyltransferase [Jannaschia formosa]